MFDLISTKLEYHKKKCIRVQRFSRSAPRAAKCQPRGSSPLRPRGRPLHCGKPFRSSPLGKHPLSFAPEGTSPSGRRAEGEASLPGQALLAAQALRDVKRPLFGLFGFAFGEVQGFIRSALTSPKAKPLGRSQRGPAACFAPEGRSQRGQALGRQRVPSLSPKGARGVPSFGRGVCRVSSRAFPTEGRRPKLSLEVRIFIRSGTRGGKPRRCLSGRWGRCACGPSGCAWAKGWRGALSLPLGKARSSGAGGATSSPSRALPASSVGRVLSNRETSGGTDGKPPASNQGLRAKPKRIASGSTKAKRVHF